MIKSMSVRLAVHVAHMGDMINSYILVRNLKERDDLEDLGVDRRIVKTWMLM
jgi:hypothetical protein